MINEIRRETKQHLHSLKLKPGQTVRNTPFTKKVFVCMDPDCSYYASAALLVGKRMKCPTCVKDYVVTKQALAGLKIPHCEECTKSEKTQVKVQAAKAMENNVVDFLANLGIKIE